jgi:outer membrane protein TolC
MTRSLLPATLVLGLLAMLVGCQEDRPAAATAQAAWPPSTMQAMDERAEKAEKAEKDRDTLPTLGENSTLRDYLAYAAMRNPALEAAFNRWKAAMERLPQETALPDPQFTFRYFVQEQMYADGAMRFTYEGAQAFPWLEKLILKGDIAAKQARAELLRFEAAMLKLSYEVRQGYYEYYYLARSIAIMEENLGLLQRVEGVASSRYEVASASQPDVIRAQVELGKLDDQLRTLKDMRGAITARLNAAMNRPAEAPLPWPAETRTGLPATLQGVSDSQLLAWLVENSPELGAMDSETAARKAAIDLARKDYLPDLTLGVELDQMFKDRDSEGGQPDNPVAVMFSVSVPIWWDKYAAAVREARARYWAAQRDRADKTNTLSSDLKMAAYRFRDADRKVNLYKDTLLPRVQQSLKATEAAYRTGKGSFTDLIDTQRILLEFQLSCERALADRAERLAEIEMLTGRQVPRPDAPPAAASQPAGPARTSTTAPAYN